MNNGNGNHPIGGATAGPIPLESLVAALKAQEAEAARPVRAGKSAVEEVTPPEIPDPLPFGVGREEVEYFLSRIGNRRLNMFERSLANHNLKDLLGIEEPGPKPRETPRPYTPGTPTRKALAREAAEARANAEWEPVIDDDLPRGLRFPIDVFPAALGEYADACARSIPCRVDFVAAPLLAFAGAAMGRTMAIWHKAGWRIYPLHYLAMIAGVDQGKSAGMRAAGKPAETLARRLFKKHSDKVRENPKPDTPHVEERFAVGNFTLEALVPMHVENPRGLIAVADEINAFFGGMDQYKAPGKGTDRQFWLENWLSLPYDYNRKGPIPGQRVRHWLAEPCASLLGGAQPEVLVRMKLGEKGDGLVERMLYVFPETMSRRYCTEAVPTRLLELWEDGFNKLHGRELRVDEYGLSRPVEVPFTLEALECFVAWYDANAAEAEGDQMTKSLGQAWGKLTVYACRFALVIEQLRWAYESAPSDGVRPVALDSLEKALRLVDYFKSHTRRAHALMRGGHGGDDFAKTIRGWILRGRREAFKVNYCRSSFRDRIKLEGGEAEFEKALAWLVQRNYIRHVEGSVLNRGRPGHGSMVSNPTWLKSAQK